MTRLALLTALLIAPPALATGRFLPGDSVRDRGRAGAGVTSERGVSSLQINPALLGMVDNLALDFGWTQASELGEFNRAGPYTSGSEDQPAFTAAMGALGGDSRGVAQSKAEDTLFNIGMAYGFGTTGFRMGLGYARLPVENHVFDSAGPQRYRLIQSADQRDQFSLGFAGAFSRRFAIGAALHWERLVRVRRLMISTTPMTTAAAEETYHIEGAAHDHMVDVTGTVPIGFGSNAFVPTAAVGLWARLFAGLEMGVSVSLGGTGASEDGTIDVLDTLPNGGDTDIFVRQGNSNAANVTDGSPMQIRAGLRYQFETWDLEFEWRMESWSSDTQMRTSAAGAEQGVAWFETTEAGAEAVALPDLGDGNPLETAMSYHVGSDIWLVPNGLALRVGLSYEGSPTAQPDAALFAGPRYGVGAGMTFSDRGYAIDAGYLHLFSDSVEVTSGTTGLRNMLAINDEAPVPIQNNGKYTTSVGFFGVGVRADMDRFSKIRSEQRKAWYQIWSRGATGFGRGGF